MTRIYRLLLSAAMMTCASPRVTLAAAPACATCHARQAQSLAETGMGRSFGVVGEPPLAAADATFLHAASRSRAAVQGTRHLVNGEGHDVRYAVGSGRAGTSYLIDRGGWLFQSPISYYAGRRAHWGVSPGYETDARLTFSRPVSEDCVFCHAGSANFVRGSLNRFSNPPADNPGIPCERCHGPGGPHADSPSAGNIVNPARLDDAVLRASICEQCHLSGEARIWNRGKTWRDLKPGRAPLEDSLTVFVRPAGPDALHVVSHVEQLAASRCFQQSGGMMWCGSCHRVHGGKDNYRQACVNCHRDLTASRHPQDRQDCVGCHMPRRAAIDGGHTAVSDHRIARRPVRSEALQPPRAPVSLRSWRPGPATDTRDLGLAYIAAGDRWASPELSQKGFALLAPRQPEFTRDPEVLGALGYVLLQKQRPGEATGLLAAAVGLAPRDVRLRLHLALALASAGKKDTARRALRELLELDPQVDAARAALSQLDQE